MAKVYVITISEVYDFEEFVHEIEAFRDKKDANKRFKEIVKEAKKEYKDFHWGVEGNGTTFFETYPAGCFSESHYGVYLNEVEVR